MSRALGSWLSVHVSWSEEVGQAPRAHRKYHVIDDVTSLKYSNGHRDFESLCCLRTTTPKMV